MSLEQQELENFFQNLKPNDGLPGDFDPSTEQNEFDSFFEKLSTLEDLTWNDDMESAPEIIEPVRAKSSRSQASKPQTSKPKPQVYHTSRPSSPKRQRQATTQSNPHRQTLESSAGNKVKVVAKFVMMASVLFSVGMGAGWLALSLPERFSGSKIDRNFTSRAQFQDSTEIAESVKSDNTGALDVAKETTAEKETPLQVQEITADANQQEASVPGATPVPGAPVAPSVIPSKMPVVETPPSAPKAPMVSQGTGYSLQVGACQSESCVARYRKMLGAHVEADQIQVVKKTIASSGKVVLRVRIAPMEKTAANTLKAKLATVDTRFKDAYLTVVN